MNKPNIIAILGLIHQDLLEKENYLAAIEKLESLKIHKLINYLVYIVDEYDVEDKLILQLLIRILQNIFNNSSETSPVTNEDYDKLYELNRIHNGEEIVGSSFNKNNKIVSSHKYPDLRGTLDKAHFIRIKDKGKDKRKSIEDIKKSMENKIGRALTAKESEIYLFPKWDGVSEIFECDGDGNVEKALSRGDTDLNEAVDGTRLFKGTNFRYIKNDYNNTHEFGVKTEVVMSRDDYKEFCTTEGQFNNPRSAVTSIVTSLDFNKDYLKYLTIVPLQVQDFETKEIYIPKPVYSDFPFEIGNLNNLDEIKLGMKRIQDTVALKIGIDIDGVVIRLKDKNIQALLGREGKINKYEFAYKFPPEQKKTIIKDVKFSVGLLGSITPVAQIKPVIIKGNKISNISLGSMDRFEELGLRVGDEVIIKYDVIPYLLIDNTCIKSNGPKFIAPIKCTYCDENLIEDPILKCNNDECICRMIGKIINYTTKMSISNMDTGTVTSLFESGILRSIDDLYRLKNHKEEIIKLSGFGKKSFNNIVNGINSRRNVYDYEFLGSLGIPDIGRKIFKKILNIYYIDELIDLCLNDRVDKLLLIGGIKDKTASKIINGIKSNQKLIKLLRSEINLRRDERRYTIKVCFTKIRDKEFEKFLDSKNILVLENYNKGVDILIIPTKDTESTKIKTAVRDGKDIITLEEAYKMFGYK